MSKDLTVTPFASLLPPSIAHDERMQAAAQVLDAELGRINQDTETILIWSRLDEIEEPLLSTLAWELHVDHWDDTWSLDAKRETVKNAYILHMYKGTPGAVELAVASVVGNGLVEEWYEYGGEQGYFRVHVDLISRGMDADTWDDMTLLINQYKNTRSWLEGVLITLQGQGLQFLAPALIGGETLTVYPYNITALEQSMPSYVGVGYQAVETISVYPQ